MMSQTPTTSQTMHWVVLLAVGALVGLTPAWTRADDFALGADTRVWHRNVGTAWQQAVEKNRPLLMYISTARCAHCRKMQATLADPDVVSLVDESLVAVAVDGKRERKLVRQLAVRAYPTTLVIAPDGREVGRLEGYAAANVFGRDLAEAINLAHEQKNVAERPTRLR